METKVSETKKIVITRRFAASPEKVFKAWTNADAVARWFAPNDEMTAEVLELDPTPGGRYRIKMNHQFGAEHIVGGIFQNVDKPSQIAMTFKWEGEEMGGLPETRLIIDMAPIEGGTEMTLTHEGFDSDESANGHVHGWNGCTWRLGRMFDDDTLRESSTILALNRKLFRNALADVSSEDANKRTSATSNHILWIAGHIAHTRAMIAQLLGQEAGDELKIFNDEISDSASYPDLQTVQDFFNKITHQVHGGLSTTSAETLAGPPPFALPITEQSLGGAIAFLVQHEAYHIGQLGLLRKELGYPAMSYA